MRARADPLLGAAGLHRGGGVLAHDDAQGRGAAHAEPRHVVSLPLQQMVPGRRQGADDGVGRARDEPHGRARGKMQQLGHPALADGLQPRGHGRHGGQGGVLVPGVRQPGCGVRHREQAAIDEAEEASARLGRRGRRSHAMQQGEDLHGIHARHGQGPVKDVQTGDGLGFRGGGHGVDALQVRDGAVAGALQQTAVRIGHDFRHGFPPARPAGPALADGSGAAPAQRRTPPRQGPSTTGGKRAAPRITPGPAAAGGACARPPGRRRARTRAGLFRRARPPGLPAERTAGGDGVTMPPHGAGRLDPGRRRAAIRPSPAPTAKKDLIFGRK